MTTGTLGSFPRNGEAASHHRVLVTGGAGFIGSHVVAELLREGVPVTVLDDLSTGMLENLPDDRGLRFVYGDVADHAAIAEALTGCARVVHLAAIASVQRSVEDPVGTHRVNYEATARLLESAHRHGVRRFVYASSAAVYGDVQTPPVDEVGALDPRTPYAVDKLMGEKALAGFRREHGLEGVALRFFNVYGPRQRSDSPYSGVISLFARQLLRGEPVTVYGDGEQTRDFVFVGDVVRALVELTLRPAPPTAPVLNVGRGETVSVLRLLDAVEAAFGVKVERRFVPARAGDVRHSSANVARLHEELGWVPTTCLEAGLARLLEEARDGVRTAAPCTDAP